MTAQLFNPICFFKQNNSTELLNPKKNNRTTPLFISGAALKAQKYQQNKSKKNQITTTVRDKALQFNEIVNSKRPENMAELKWRVCTSKDQKILAFSIVKFDLNNPDDISSKRTQTERICQSFSELGMRYGKTGSGWVLMLPDFESIDCEACRNSQANTPNNMINK